MLREAAVDRPARAERCAGGRDRALAVILVIGAGLMARSFRRC
jgi:hypothetical protein